MKGLHLVFSIVSLFSLSSALQAADPVSYGCDFDRSFDSTHRTDKTRPGVLDTYSEGIVVQVRGNKARFLVAGEHGETVAVLESKIDRDYEPRRYKNFVRYRDLNVVEGSIKEALLLPSLNWFLVQKSLVRGLSKGELLVTGSSGEGSTTDVYKCERLKPRQH